MASHVSKEEIIALINERDDEELAELLRILKTNSYAVSSVRKESTKGERISDAIAAFAGSWPFIISFIVLLIAWISYNLTSNTPMDPFPFILLNLVLSTVAAIQAPLILMSQNREEQRNKEQQNATFFIDVKSEVLLEDVHERLMQLEEKIDRCVPPSK